MIVVEKKTRFMYKYYNITKSNSSFYSGRFHPPNKKGR